jgi:hypothetical protein
VTVDWIWAADETWKDELSLGAASLAVLHPPGFDITKPMGFAARSDPCSLGLLGIQVIDRVSFTRLQSGLKNVMDFPMGLC